MIDKRKVMDKIEKYVEIKWKIGNANLGQEIFENIEKSIQFL